MPNNSIAPAIPPEINQPNWTRAGWVGLISAALSLIGFFLLWSNYPSSWVMAGSGFSILVSNFALLQGSSLLGASFDLFSCIILILFLVFEILLVAIPLVGLVVARDSFKMLGNSATADSPLRQRWLYEQKRGSNAGIICMIVLFLAIQGFALFNQTLGCTAAMPNPCNTASAPGPGIGWVLSMIGLLLVRFLVPRVAPRRT